MARALEGFLAAACVAFAAKRAGSLSRSGALAAIVVGTLAVAVGWDWGALLLAYFVSSSVLSRVGRGTKERRTASIVEKGGARDAIQVLANGGVFAGAAAAMLERPDIRWVAVAAGALAASAADTWATELGTLAGGRPRSIVSWRPVPAGTSGGISVVGSLAAVAGAAFIAGVLVALGWTISLAPTVALAGIAGAAVDSLLGATLQSRRWCEICSGETERITHECGEPTRQLRGLEWLDNDVVNFLSTVAAGLLSAALVGRVRG
ncbi:MAG: DUF92 domain-containing protein [Gemmatimonadaceae bacterium]